MTETTEQNSADKEKEQDISKEDIDNTNPSNKEEVVVKGEDLNGDVVNESVKPNKPHRFQPGQSGNPKGRPKGKAFSIREDLIKSLKRIRKNKPELYQKIIDSYWEDGKMRQFLLEIVDGKARQSTEILGSLENPIRIIEIKPMAEEENKCKV